MTGKELRILRRHVLLQMLGEQSREVAGRVSELGGKKEER